MVSTAALPAVSNTIADCKATYVSLTIVPNILVFLIMLRSMRDNATVTMCLDAEDTMVPF